MDARHYLEQIKMCDAKINAKILEKEQWFALATKTNAPMEGERVQSSGNPDKVANAVIKIQEIEKEIDDMIDHFVDLKKEVISVIEQVNDPEQFKILHALYVDYKKLTDVCDEIGFTYQWCVELHNRGLDAVQVILDSRT